MAVVYRTSICVGPVLGGEEEEAGSDGKSLNISGILERIQLSWEFGSCFLNITKELLGVCHSRDRQQSPGLSTCLLCL